jgi:membrane protease YdiL (CAAX protease family)
MRLVLWLLLVASFAALNFSSRAAGERPPDDFVYRYEYAVSGIASYLVLLALVLALTVGVPRRGVLALRRPPSWGRALGLSVGALVAIFIGVYATLVVSGAGDEQNLAPEGWDGSRAGAYALSFVAIAFVGPLAEELLYRGVGLSLVAERFGAAAAVVGTSILFGLGHGLLLSLPAFIWFGVVVALLRLRTASLYPACLVHCTFNGIGMIAPLFL